MNTPPHPSNKNGRVIRHAGRCLVRGKIRRVWRPRYLELCDNGLVRYYELPPSSSTADHHHHEQHSIPTRGSEDQDWDRVSVGTEHHRHGCGVVLNNMGVPKCTLQVLSSRIIDVTTLRDLHVGLPRGQYGFCLYAVRQLTMRDEQECSMQHYPLDPTERDFLCAVSTLEEAQAWVIALQWAASLKPILMVGGGDSDAGDVMDYYTADGGAPFRATNHHRRPQRPSALALPTPSATVRTRPRIKTSSSRKGKIVVSKLRSLSFVRTLHGFDLAYRIQLLLLKSSSTGSSMVERTLLRTHEEIQQLIDELNYEVTSAKSGHVLERAQSILRASSPPTGRGNYKTMMTLLPKVDGILKSFSMDGGICNSAALRKFWSLGGDTNNSSTTANNSTVYVLQSFPLLVIHDVNSIVKQQPLPPTTTSTEAFVKEWLGSTPWERYSDKKAAIAWTLQRPLYVAACIISPLFLFRPLLYVRNAWLPTITFKLDTLLVTYGLIWYATKRVVESQQRPTSPSKAARATPKKIVHTSASGIIDDEEQSTDDEGDFADGTNSTVASDIPAVSSSSPKSDDENKVLSSPLPQYPDNNGTSCWSKPKENLFKVRSATYLQDRVKLPSGPAPFECRGIDMWLTENAERHIARHPAVCGGKLADCDTFLVNFLLPFGNFCAYFRVPPLQDFPPKLAKVWTEFVRGDQQYRDARLKLLPVVLEGPWIVKTAVGPGTSPALLGKVIPLQYYFSTPKAAGSNHKEKHCYYEVDVIITASQIAKGILSVVKGHTKALDIAFAFIIEASTEEDLPETVLCSFALHALHLEDCPHLPEHNLDEHEEEGGMSMS